MRHFYDLVEQHEYEAAARLWTPRMRANYPPNEYINGRFDLTTRIDIDRLKRIALDQGAGTAVVSVAITEHRSDGSSRIYDGTWELVRRDGRWLMDEPHFS